VSPQSSLVHTIIDVSVVRPGDFVPVLGYSALRIEIIFFEDYSTSFASLNPVVMSAGDSHGLRRLVWCGPRCGHGGGKPVWIGSVCQI